MPERSTGDPPSVQCHSQHLIPELNGLNIHRRQSLTDLLGDWVGGEVWDRFIVNYTPTHGSWLDQVEIDIGMLTRQCLGNRRIRDLAPCARKPARGAA